MVPVVPSAAVPVIVYDDQALKDEGSPLMRHVLPDLLKLSPNGKAEDIVHESTAPPVFVRSKVLGNPSAKFWLLGVEKTGGLPRLIVIVIVAVLALPSAAVAVTVNVTEDISIVGVPEILQLESKTVSDRP